MAVSIQQARRAKDQLAKTLAHAEGLVGLGITKVGEDYAVKVNFSRKPNATVPTTLAGVPIRVEVTGKIRKRN